MPLLPARRFVVLSGLLLLLSAWLAPLHGQRPTPPPPCVSGCITYGVTVTPDGAPTSALPNTAGNERDFLIMNTGTSNASDTYTLTCTGAGGVVCDSIKVTLGGLAAPRPLRGISLRGPRVNSPFCPPTCAVTGSVTLTGGTMAGVQAWYHLTTTSGTLTLNATGSFAVDDGSYNVMLQLTPTGPLVVRDLCLTVAAGPSAAYECGDLRIVHPLPGIRTLDKPRTPTLLYNSQNAYPFPSLNSDLTLAVNNRPDSIIAIARLKVGGSFVQRDRRAWPGTQWGAPSQSTTRRVMTNFPATDLATGIYFFQLELDRYVAGSGYTAIRTDTGSVAIVNRVASRFGAGWWLAGFEQLQFQADNSILWIGGDGSVRRYVNLGAWNGKTWYVARAVGAPDTLSFNGTTYTRSLRGGAKVVFNTTGFHIQTVSRLGYVTVFAPDGSNRLSTITVPPTGTGRSYTFTYGGPNGTLSSVTSPDSIGGGGRVTSISGAAVTGGARISTITDPGIATGVQFLYGNATYPGAITGRTDRRGATTTYTLGTGLKLVGSSLPVPGAATIAMAFCPAEIRVWTCGSGLAAPESTYTVLDGPRTDSVDVSHFWLDSLGAVSQIRDAYASLTTIARGDSRWPGLATRMRSPSGRIVTATYDQRGNLAAVADSNPYGNGLSPTTRYYWDQKWDQLTQIMLANGQLSQFGVDTANGNRLWVQDGRGTVSRTTFQYLSSGNGAGLLGKVIPPIGAQTSISYDPRGNTASVQTGGWTTSYQNDSLGRTKVVRTPIGSGLYRSDTTTFDLAGRPIRQATYGPSVSGAAASLFTVNNIYDNESNLTNVLRTQSPDPTFLGGLTTQWVFDAANRPVVEIAPDLMRDSTGYDPAGNVVASRTRRGKVLTMTYDRLNRLRRRIAPADTFPARVGPGLLSTIPLASASDPTGHLHPYPWFPNSGTGLVIGATTDTFAYDIGGGLSAADNGDARIRRRYFKDGSLQTDSLWIRDYAGASFSHVYGLRYTYDINGRVTALRHPAQLAAGTGMRDSVRYVYNDTTGAIASVYSLLGQPTTFQYDLTGGVVRKEVPGGIIDSTAYDSLGRLIQDRIRNASSSPFKDPDSYLRYEALHYDVQPDLVSWTTNTHGPKNQTTATYDGLNRLVSLAFHRPQNLNDQAFFSWGDSANQGSTFDPMGNSYRSSLFESGRINYEVVESSWSSGSDSLQNGTGRLVRRNADHAFGFVYDSAGNTVFNYQANTTPYMNGTTLIDRASWYGSDSRVRVEERRTGLNNGSFGSPGYPPDWSNPGWLDIFEEYRYDALGRRVLVMSRQNCSGGSGTPTPLDCSVSRIRRTVWEGARELWEIQMPAGPADSLLIENDVNPVTTYLAGQYGWRGVYSDPNPLFGRVGYAYSGGIDQPLAVTRLSLVRRKDTTDTKTWAPVDCTRTGTGAARRRWAPFRMEGSRPVGMPLTACSCSGVERRSPWGWRRSGSGPMALFILTRTRTAGSARSSPARRMAPGPSIVATGSSTP